MPSPFVAARQQAVLQGLPHVQAVVGLLSEMLSVGDGGPPLFVFGWAWRSYLWDHLRLQAGRWPASDEEDAVVIGTIAAGLLHKGLGDVVEIEGRRLAVVGVFESPAMVENGALIATLSLAQKLTDKRGKVNVLNLKLDADTTEAQLAALKAHVAAALPGFVAITSGELVRQNTVVRIAKAMSRATMLVASLVGALMVFNTMLMSISERTREIGLLQAVGWSRGLIARLVIAESTLLSFAGGLAGIALGVGLTFGLEHLELMRGKIDAVFSLPFYGGVAALSVLLGIGGGLYPAFKAARLQPSQALRQEG